MREEIPSLSSPVKYLGETKNHSLEYLGYFLSPV